MDSIAILSIIPEFRDKIYQPLVVPPWKQDSLSAKKKSRQALFTSFVSPAVSCTHNPPNGNRRNIFKLASHWYFLFGWASTRYKLPARGRTCRRECVFSPRNFYVTYVMYRVLIYLYLHCEEKKKITTKCAVTIQCIFI